MAGFVLGYLDGAPKAFARAQRTRRQFGMVFATTNASGHG